jgi:hypothetical protein
MLTLPRQFREALRFTPAPFAALCAAHPDAVLELPGLRLDRQERWAA